jgi:hypothetical protein
MTYNLHALASNLEESAPDLKIAALMEKERAQIEEALETVGEYVLSDDEGNIYVITAQKPTKKSEVDATSAL